MYALDYNDFFPNMNSSGRKWLWDLTQANTVTGTWGANPYVPRKMFFCPSSNDGAWSTPTTGTGNVSYGANLNLLKYDAVNPNWLNVSSLQRLKKKNKGSVLVFVGDTVGGKEATSVGFSDPIGYILQTKYFSTSSIWYPGISVTGKWYPVAARHKLAAHFLFDDGHCGKLSVTQMVADKKKYFYPFWDSGVWNY
jgi:hypothetical protein